MNEDQLNGRFEEAIGRTKKAAGRAFGNKALEREGRLQNAYGKIQMAVGNLRESMKRYFWTRTPPWRFLG